MTDKRKGARLGFDPLAGKEGPKGIDNLIRSTTHETQTEPITHTTQTAHKIPGKKGERGEPLPRINMAFDPDQIEYLRTMAGLENISVTRYIYNLIAADMATRNERYGKIAALKEAKK